LISKQPLSECVAIVTQERNTEFPDNLVEILDMLVSKVPTVRCSIVILLTLPR